MLRHILSYCKTEGMYVELTENRQKMLHNCGNIQIEQQHFFCPFPNTYQSRHRNQKVNPAGLGSS